MKLFLFSWLLLGLIHCQASGTANAGSTHESSVGNQIAISPTDKAPQSHLMALFQRHEVWQNTPHKIGGFDHNGVDCSGFVVLTFAEEFGIDLPRSTQDQAKIGNEIPAHTMNTGDLVFFKIPNQKRYYHVGIYLENQKFLHASSSKGVTISDLNNSYWHSNYWKSIRVLK